MHIRGPVEPMLGKLTKRLPSAAAAKGWVWEPKWDGFRCLARVTDEGVVHLSSRRRKPMDIQFPDVKMAVYEHVPAGSVIDGEIVRWVNGRLDFGALQHRYAAGRRADALVADEPCHYLVFDLLELEGEDLRDRPLSERRARLEELFTAVPGTSSLQPSMQTDDHATARAWSEALAEVGVEGLIGKRANGKYRPGARDWLKVKQYATTEAIIGGVTGSLSRPAEVLLGRYSLESGELFIAGRTVPLNDRQAADVAAVITPAGGQHPWPAALPPSWATRGPTEYIRVEPATVAEVRVDVAKVGQRWRHGLRFLRLRPDLGPGDVQTDLDLEV